VRRLDRNGIYILRITAEKMLIAINFSNIKIKCADLKFPIPAASRRGISEIFPSDQPVLKKEFAASNGEFDPKRLKIKYSHRQSVQEKHF